MFKKCDFFENEAKILLHETAHDGALASAELWKRIQKALEFIDGNCHPDFHIDFFNGLLVCIQKEQNCLRGSNGTVDHTARREWGD